VAVDRGMPAKRHRLFLAKPLLRASCSLQMRAPPAEPNILCAGEWEGSPPIFRKQKNNSIAGASSLPFPSREGANCWSAAEAIRGRGRLCEQSPSPNPHMLRMFGLPPPARGGRTKLRRFEWELWRERLAGGRGVRFRENNHTRSRGACAFGNNSILHPGQSRGRGGTRARENKDQDGEVRRAG
jgi:hypothetical protein